MDQPVDRRSAVKRRHRRAILTAAAELMDTTGGTAFSVDELADRAGVSRRTVFNHFGSLDDVVAQVSANVLSELVDNLAAAAPPEALPPGATLLDEVDEVVRSTDLVTPMAYLTRTLGGEDPQSPFQDRLLTQAIEQVGTGLVEVLRRRHPDAELLDLQLLVSSVTAGVIVLHQHWWQRTGAVDSPSSRTVWNELLTHLFTQLRSGFTATTRGEAAQRRRT